MWSCPEPAAMLSDYWSEGAITRVTILHAACCRGWAIRMLVNLLEISRHDFDIRNDAKENSRREASMFFSDFQYIRMCVTLSLTCFRSILWCSLNLSVNLQRGEAEEAVQLLSFALKVEDKEPQLLFNLGLALRKSGRHVLLCSVWRGKTATFFAGKMRNNWEIEVLDHMKAALYCKDLFNLNFKACTLNWRSCMKIWHIISKGHTHRGQPKADISAEDDKVRYRWGCILWGSLKQNISFIW